MKNENDVTALQRHTQRTVKQALEIEAKLLVLYW
jgi:hypothetical protein